MRAADTWMAPLDDAVLHMGAHSYVAFIDTPVGAFLAIFLHSVGAILFAAGIAAYFLVARALSLPRGQRGTGLGLLPFAHWATIAGLLLNGIGGLMRWSESDQPGLGQFGSSLWVQVLLIKTLFLLVGAGFAVWVTLRTQAPEPEAHPEPLLGLEPNRIRSYSAISMASILLATVLGAVAVQAPVPGTEDNGPSFVGDPGGVRINETSVSFRDQGTIQATALTPATQRALGFTVLNATLEIRVDLRWDRPQSTLSLRLLDPEGRSVDGQREDLGNTGRRLTVTTGILGGEWIVEVSSYMAPAPTDYEVLARMRLGELDHELLEGEVTLAPTERIFEINLHLPHTKALHYDWRVVDDPPQGLAFNVHTHRNDEVQYVVQNHRTSYAGNWTQDSSSNDGVSLMWEPEDADGTKYTQPVTFRYRVYGPFTVGSIVER